MILITGAGGKTGKAITKALSNESTVCAFVHREEHVAVLKSYGAEKVIVGDMRVGSSIRSAMQDVVAIYHICPNMNPDELEIGKQIIREAKNAGVEHVVYHSVLHSQTEKMHHHWQKMRVEEMIFESGLPFTILQPAPYMQNLLASWKNIVENGILHVPYSVQARFSFIDLEDLAEAAKIVLTQPGHRYASYELAGIEPASHLEVAEVISHTLKMDVRAEKEEIEAWKSRAAGLSEYAIENLTRMFEYYDQWGLAGNPNTLKWLLNKESTTLEAFLDRIAHEHDAAH